MPFINSDFFQLLQKSPLFEGVNDTTIDLANTELKRVSSDPIAPKRLIYLNKLMNIGSLYMYEDKLFNTSHNPDIHHQLLLLHLKNSISNIQLATAYFFLSAQKALSKKSKIRQISLFNADGSISISAKTIILLSIEAKRFNAKAYTPFANLSEKSIDAWFIKMQTYPASERRFLVSRKTKEDTSRQKDFFQILIDSSVIGLTTKEDYISFAYNTLAEKRVTITQILACNGFSLFNEYRAFSGNVIEIIPSLGMVEAMQTIAFPRSNLRLEPKFKVLNPVKSSRNGSVNNKRVIAIRNPYQKMPVTADFGYYAPWHEYTIHDIYHFFIASSIPDTHREILIAFGDVFLEAKNPELQYLAEMFYDLSSFNYRSEVIRSKLRIGKILKKPTLSYLLGSYILDTVNSLIPALIFESIPQKKSQSFQENLWDRLTRMRSLEEIISQIEKISDEISARLVYNDFSKSPEVLKYLEELSKNALNDSKWEILKAFKTLLYEMRGKTPLYSKLRHAVETILLAPDSLGKKDCIKIEEFPEEFLKLLPRVIVV